MLVCEQGTKPIEVFATYPLWSGRRDSNPRPSAPKADALARLRYAPIKGKAEHDNSLAGAQGKFQKKLAPLRNSQMEAAFTATISERPMALMTFPNTSAGDMLAQTRQALLDKERLTVEARNPTER